MLNALPVVITESADRAAQWNYRHSGRRFKRGNYAQQIAPQDENAERGQEGDKLLAAMADNLMRLAVDETVKQFGEVLNSSGPVDGEARPDQQKNPQQQRKDHQLHGEGIRDGSLRMLGLDVQRAQKRRDRTGEKAV